MRKSTIIIAVLLFGFHIGQSQSIENATILKFSAINLLLGDHCTRSWSPNFIVERSFSEKFSFQQEIGLIFQDRFIDKSFLFLPTDQLFGIRFNPEVKRYFKRKPDNGMPEGVNLALDCNVVWTNATTSVSDAEVKRLVIAPHFKAGYQLITSKRFVFEISAGLGPGFVFSKSSIPQENLGSKSYQYGILYEGGSGVYLSSHLDFKFGYLINSK